MSQDPAIYKAAVDEVKAAAEKEPKKTAASLTSVFDSEEGKKVVEDIKKISQTAISVTTEFVTVRGVLRTFDSKGYKDIKGKDINKLESTWAGYQTRFADNLKASRATALAAKVSAEEYVLFMGEVADHPKEFVLEEMPGFIKEWLDNINKSITGAEQTEKNFTTLKDEITLFATDISIAADKADKAIQKEIKDCQDRIDAIDRDLTYWNGVFRDAAIALGVSAVAFGASGALLATGFLAPVAIVGMVISALAAIGSAAAMTTAAIKRSQCETNKSNEQDNMKKLKEKAADFEKIKAQLLESDTTIKDICFKLGTIANIWSYFKTDAEQVKMGLERAKTAAETSAYMTQLYLGNKFTLAVYRRLGELLGDYAANIKDVVEKK